MSAGAVVLLVLRGVGAMRQWCQRFRRRGSWLAELILLKCAWACLFYGIVGNLLPSTPNDLSARLTLVSGGLIPLPQVAETLTTDSLRLESLNSALRYISGRGMTAVQSLSSVVGT